MQNLTPAGQNIVNDIANRYQLSLDAVVHMLIAVNNGGGSMAQFNSPELGGSGQWMRGGMTMVGDMFNMGLQARVDNLCNELSNALANNQIFPALPAYTSTSNHWWPGDLGQPISSGSQNTLRYAVFPGRLAVENQGNVVLYDTLDHQISGVSQQQGGDTSLSFSSQYGTISVTSLPIISGTATAEAQSNFAKSPAEQQGTSQAQPSNVNSQSGATSPSSEVVQLLEQLGRLRDAGVLTQQEFDSKKLELMQRI